MTILVSPYVVILIGVVMVLTILWLAYEIIEYRKCWKNYRIVADAAVKGEVD